MCLNEAWASLHLGGGYSEYILVGCALAHQNRGILGAGTAPPPQKGEGRSYGCCMAGYRCMGVVWLDIIDVWVSCGWDIDVWVSCGWDIIDVWVSCGWDIIDVWVSYGWDIDVWVSCGWIS